MTTSEVLPGLPAIDGGYLLVGQAATVAGIARKTLNGYRARGGHYPPPAPTVIDGIAFYPRLAFEEWERRRREVGPGHRYDLTAEIAHQP